MPKLFSRILPLTATNRGTALSTGEEYSCWVENNVSDQEIEDDSTFFPAGCSRRGTRCPRNQLRFPPRLKYHCEFTRWHSTFRFIPPIISRLFSLLPFETAGTLSCTTGCFFFSGHIRYQTAMSINAVLNPMGSLHVGNLLFILTSSSSFRSPVNVDTSSLSQLSAGSKTVQSRTSVWSCFSKAITGMYQSATTSNH